MICRWFLYTAKAWNLSIAIPDIKCWCFKSLQVKGQTQDREESSDYGNDKKPVEKFELVTVLVCKAGFQRYHLWKGHKWYLAKENLRNNVVVVRFLGKPFIQKCLKHRKLISKIKKTRQSKHCGFSIYIFDNSKSKSMVRLVRAEKMVLSGLVFARKIARMILIQNI